MASKEAHGKLAVGGKSHENDNKILILLLGDDVDRKIAYLHFGKFFDALREKFGCTIVTDVASAFRFLDRSAPQFILAADSAFASLENRPLQRAVANTVASGSCLFLCCNFVTNVSYFNWKHFILNVFNLGWELDEFFYDTYTFHKTMRVLGGIQHAPGVAKELKMRVVQVRDIEDEFRMYVNEERDNGEQKGKDCCAMALRDHGKGHLAWIGDIEMTPSTQALIFNIMQRLAFAAKTRVEEAKKRRPPVQPPQVKKEEWNLDPTLVGSGNTSRRAPIETITRISRHGTLAVLQASPCGQCGKEEVTRCCTFCKTMWYCNPTCQAANHTYHQEVCPTKNLSLDQAITASLKGDSLPLIKTQLFHIKEQYEVIQRLVDIYRLRVEDLHNISGIQTGRYRPGSEDSLHLEDFIDFLVRLHQPDQQVRPEWWNLAAQNKCEDMARNPYLYTYIGNKITDEQIIEKYREQRMPQVLRRLGSCVYGGNVPQPSKSTFVPRSDNPPRGDDNDGWGSGWSDGGAGGFGGRDSGPSNYLGQGGNNSGNWGGSGISGSGRGNAGGYGDYKRPVTTDIPESDDIGVPDVPEEEPQTAVLDEPAPLTAEEQTEKERELKERKKLKASLDTKILHQMSPRWREQQRRLRDSKPIELPPIPFNPTPVPRKESEKTSHINKPRSHTEVTRLPDGGECKIVYFQNIPTKYDVRSNQQGATDTETIKKEPEVPRQDLATTLFWFQNLDKIPANDKERQEKDIALEIGDAHHKKQLALENAKKGAAKIEELIIATQMAGSRGGYDKVDFAYDAMES